MNDKTEQYWYLYLIETRYKTWYCGITRDWKRRIEEHQSNGNKTAKFLKGKGPLKLIFCIQLDNHSQALKAEIWLKKQSKAKKRASLLYRHDDPT